MFVQAAAGAAGALDISRQSRAEVDRTLQDVNRLLAQMGESSSWTSSEEQQEELLDTRPSSLLCPAQIRPALWTRSFCSRWTRLCPALRGRWSSA